jgi:hypothetical protein
LGLMSFSFRDTMHHPHILPDGGCTLSGRVNSLLSRLTKPASLDRCQTTVQYSPACLTQINQNTIK